MDRLKAPQADARDAVRRTVNKAAREGLVDVAFARADSPFGPLVLAVTDKGLVRLAFGHDPTVLDELAAKLSPRVLEVPKRLDSIRRQLDQYFEGRRKTFDVQLDWTLSHGFAERVLRATSRIPFGSVSTYAGVAGVAGNPKAARAAGGALHNNPIAIVVPCHRVIGSSGSLVGYGGGLDMKAALLRMEGVLM